jgi:hypothetical protein
MQLSQCPVTDRDQRTVVQTARNTRKEEVISHCRPVTKPALQLDSTRHATINVLRFMPLAALYNPQHLQSTETRPTCPVHATHRSTICCGECI